MNLLKSFLVVGCLVIGSSIFAQQNNTVTVTTTFNKSVTSLQMPVQAKLAPTLTLPEFTSAISLYSPTHNWYDTFIPTGDAYVQSSSIMHQVSQTNFLRDGFSGNELSQTLVRSQYNLFAPGFNTINPVRDSFNPYGASTMRDALLSGVLGMLFD